MSLVCTTWGICVNLLNVCTVCEALVPEHCVPNDCNEPRHIRHLLLQLLRFRIAFDRWSLVGCDTARRMVTASAGRSGFTTKTILSGRFLVGDAKTSDGLLCLSSEYIHWLTGIGRHTMHIIIENTANSAATQRQPNNGNKHRQQFRGVLSTLVGRKWGNSFTRNVLKATVTMAIDATTGVTRAFNDWQPNVWKIKLKQNGEMTEKKDDCVPHTAAAWEWRAMRCDSGIGQHSHTALLLSLWPIIILRGWRDTYMRGSSGKRSLIVVVWWWMDANGVQMRWCKKAVATRILGYMLGSPSDKCYNGAQYTRIEVWNVCVCSCMWLFRAQSHTSHQTVPQTVNRRRVEMLEHKDAPSGWVFSWIRSGATSCNSIFFFFAFFLCCCTILWDVRNVSDSWNCLHWTAFGIADDGHKSCYRQRKIELIFVLFLG